MYQIFNMQFSRYIAKTKCFECVESLLADFFNALMVIPNVLALLALSHVVVAADRKAEAITKNVTQAYRAAEEK